MTCRALGLLLLLGWAAGACGGADGEPEPRAPAARQQVGAEGDAAELGHELFDLVDRAVDYRGSHRGRPPASLRQMGVDSLTPTTSRFLVTLEREPVVTVRFRRPENREITGCRGDSQILEEATLNGGRFTLMCTARSGAQRPIQIGPGGSP